MTGASNAGTQDASSSLEEKLKALELEKQMMEAAMQNMRSDFDEFRKQSDMEKQRLVQEIQKSKQMTQRGDSGTEASTSSEEGEDTEEEHDDSMDQIMFGKRKDLVQKTWKAVQESLNVEATKLFYKHLFERFPSVVPLFAKGEIEVQAAKLYQTLSLAVESLDDLDLLIPKLEELGAKHATSYHAERAHYDAVGECLLWTLKTGLGQAWTDEVASAWAWVYGIISKTMADAGDKAVAQRRKSIVQKTWKDVESTLNVQATKLFYKRLFETHPTVIPLFINGDLEVQAAKLFQMLCLAVEALDHMDTLIPTLADLGARHALQFKAERAHYDAVGECLMWTLQEGLGRAWTENVADAWTWVYGIISKTMADAGDKARFGSNHKTKTNKDDSMDQIMFGKRKSLVQETWKAVQESLDVESTKLFYKHLFERFPSVVPLFAKGEIEVQAAKLYQTLSLAVESLDDLDLLIPKLEELGAKHATSFHTERAHYDAVGECLLWTLKTGLGQAWTDDVASAWAWVYGVISKTMADAGDKALAERRKSIVQKTWKDVESTLNVQATKLFYKRLFETHPTVIPLFVKGNIEVQAAKLFQMLCLAVEALDQMDTLIPQLEDLGARHALHFKTERVHYDAVGECLMWTLQTGLGWAWTENVADAWAWVYGIISKTMADAGDKALFGPKHKAKSNKKTTSKERLSSNKHQLMEMEKAMYNLRCQNQETIEELEAENRRLKEQNEDVLVNIREILVLKSDVSGNETARKLKEMEQALFSLRLQTDETIQRFETENRRLTEEREDAFVNLREILLLQSKATLDQRRELSSAIPFEESAVPSNARRESSGAIGLKSEIEITFTESGDETETGNMFAPESGGDESEEVDILGQTLLLETSLVDQRTTYEERIKTLENEKRRLVEDKDKAFESMREILTITATAVQNEQRQDSRPKVEAPMVTDRVEISSSDAIATATAERRKSLVKGTWKAVQASLNVQATHLFYKHLFEQYPAVVPLFSEGDIEVQAAKLYQTLSLAVESLDDLDNLVPRLQELGAKHATAFGAERGHYDAVGECLLWTLKTGLGEAWTDEVAVAWAWVYGVVSKAMADAGDKAVAERRKSIVQKTWKDVETTLNVEATKLFYKRLFEMHPTVIPLFHRGSMEEQAAKLFQTLTLAVEALDHLDILIPTLEELGVRHALQFQTERSHYDAVGECLLWTLKTGLGASWTENVSDAWTWVYGIISQTMADAGEKARVGVVHKFGSSSDEASFSDKTKTQLVEKVLVNVRVEYESKIKVLEAENNRLAAEKDEAFARMKDMFQSNILPEEEEQAEKLILLEAEKKRLVVEKEEAFARVRALENDQRDHSVLSGEMKNLQDLVASLRSEIQTMKDVQLSRAEDQPRNVEKKHEVSRTIADGTFPCEKPALDNRGREALLHDFLRFGMRVLEAPVENNIKRKLND